MPWEEEGEKGGGMAVEDDGEWPDDSAVASLWMSSSSLRVMVWRVSLRDNWWVMSLVMESSSLSEFTLDWVGSSIEDEQREHQIVIARGW